MTAASDVAPVREELFDAGAGRLLAGRCSRCEQLSFPVAAYCSHCGASSLAPEPVGATGVIYSYTVARFAPPGYAGEVPYAVGLVDLPEGIRVTTTLTAGDLGALQVGADVRFQLIEVETEEGPVQSWAYELP